MRIVAGTFRGRRLAAIGKGDTQAHLRPTSDRVRESLFNILGNMGVVQNVHVLDLFAGTGALGLEALSRGATFATFVEKGRVGLRLIRENIATLGCAESCNVLSVDAARLPKAHDAAGLVFLDPPYGQGAGDKALSAARQAAWLAPGAVVVWEENAPQSAPSGFAVLDTREFGGTVVTFLKYTL